MSRALGAAFLNHQVEQLEKSVASGTTGPASGNWRRQQRLSQSPPGVHGTQLPNANAHANGNAKRPPMAPGIKVANRRPGEDSQAARKARGTARDAAAGGAVKGQSQDARKEGERMREERKEKESTRDADVVVVDASVLVHALYQLKKWCRDGREEVVIVPLEALNTLDLLKKGTSHLAQRARAASRVLEAQVGTNPRIRVQQDDAFVLWDKIEFSDNAAANPAPSTSPEWVRRTICCAQWEVEAASKNSNSDNEKDKDAFEEGEGQSQEKNEQKTKEKTTTRKVILAVLGSAPDPSTSLSLNEPSSTPAPITPVPLPAPHVHINKHEPRSSGQLVAQWAARANIKLLSIEPSVHSDEEGHGHGHGHGAKSKRRRPSDAHGHSGKAHHGHGHGYSQVQGALVERPPAVMAMMEVVAQPSRTVRVLARGEKLDPDP
ncbi:hypothetical protein C0995_011371 [Termitomyces sp. Mi166|nr:hypothetical protein C0995_011371 [Termitomyces sp. Mi166\